MPLMPKWFAATPGKASYGGGECTIKFPSILSFAHSLVRDRVRPGDTVVDATTGNGHDTLFLANLVGKSGRVYAFDLQETALVNTRKRLEEASIPPNIVNLFLENHANLLGVLTPETVGSVAAIMFNLGYLPGSDRKVITKPESTLAAFDSGLKALRPGGVLAAVVYSGHEGGTEEAAAVNAWAAELPQEQFQVLRYQFMNQRHSPPYVVAVEKLR